MRTVAMYAPSKTFNLAGLQTAFVVIPNDDIRAIFERGLTANRIFNMNWFGQVALEVAYNQCEDYVTGLCEYVNAKISRSSLSRRSWRVSEMVSPAKVISRGNLGDTAQYGICE